MIVQPVYSTYETPKHVTFTFGAGGGGDKHILFWYKVHRKGWGAALSATLHASLISSLTYPFIHSFIELSAVSTF